MWSINYLVMCYCGGIYATISRPNMEWIHVELYRWSPWYCFETSKKPTQTHVPTSISAIQRHAVVVTIQWSTTYIYRPSRGRRRWQSAESNNTDTAGHPADGRRASNQRRRSRSFSVVAVDRFQRVRINGQETVRVYDTLGSQDVQRRRTFTTLWRPRRLLQQHSLVTWFQGTYRLNAAGSMSSARRATDICLKIHESTLSNAHRYAA